ncbi:hypothetical protein ANO11243_029590 [Dothideomycetidae sp. 11243]|nr:hypothetical protein ANO11243_029590 [fungal sp. No.11243]
MNSKTDDEDDAGDGQAMGGSVEKQDYHLLHIHTASSCVTFCVVGGSLGHRQICRPVSALPVPACHTDTGREVEEDCGHANLLGRLRSKCLLLLSGWAVVAAQCCFSWNVPGSREAERRRWRRRLRQQMRKAAAARIGLSILSCRRREVNVYVHAYATTQLIQPWGESERLLESEKNWVRPGLLLPPSASLLPQKLALSHVVCSRLQLLFCVCDGDTGKNEPRNRTFPQRKKNPRPQPGHVSCPRPSRALITRIRGK